MTTRDNLPKNNKHFGQMLQQATLINLQNILNDEPKTLQCVRAERLQRLCFHELVGREKQWENDKEGGWDERWMGGGAKGEPWLIKWLCFAKPWPPPCFLPPTILSRWDPSHKASIVLLACHSPTTHTHTSPIRVPNPNPPRLVPPEHPHNLPSQYPAECLRMEAGQQ